ncbi:mediator of RNA polymerase II transcription subunit 31 [Nematocida major]|uniref:mediator of RNA polymerase II transcription subunit 31 n=1 Tax=Nematocida major TaxID=1912982 RepID=UPI002008B9C2|nr:mediator of RNA polymerase II transcription subunit 31 [Nematocida major]KAH9386643.1 mediator of RNA polymerase II transcription subunit 31 [Nematocida major]
MSRFTEELEFVQCLCNPQYLQHLYQKGYFNRADFRQFLEYLQYWKRPEYAKCLFFPQALNILDLLINSKEFVESLKYKQMVDFLASQQYLQWKNRR